MNYEQSCARLIAEQLIDEEYPPLPSRMPSYDDDAPLGVSFFRTEVSDFAFDDMTLPRTFFGRSLIASATFRKTNLRESRMCWNDFEAVDFSGADLSLCDMRASAYSSVNFTNANLNGADLRQSEFTECIFTSATLDGVKLTAEQGETLPLSEEQRQVVDWQDEDGEEPGGG